jgi:excisionase family DNA binding protein
MKKGKRKKTVLSDELQSETMTVREVAQYLNCHFFTVYRLIRQSALPGFRLGGARDWRFRRSDVNQWIAARPGMKKISAPAKPAPAPAEEIMTVQSLVDYLRCSQRMIYKLVKKKQIPAFKIGTDWRFFRPAIDDWIATQYDITRPPLTRGPKPKVS